MGKAEKFSLYRVFSSGMVLQRGKPIVFSGKADSGNELQLRFAERECTVSADARGEWQAEFPAMTAGGPYVLEVAGDRSVPVLRLEDILIGDVWVCSGQSNMEMPLCGTPFFSAANAEKEAAAANDPKLRLFNQNPIRAASPDAPLDDVADGIVWERCTPKSVRDFSACGYFFGRELRQDLHVPIGLISSSWGGSCIKSWISREKWMEEGCTSLLKDLDDSVAALKRDGNGEPWQVKLARWLEQFRAQEKAAHFEDCLQPDYDDSAWESGGGAFFATEKVGCRVFRASFELPKEMAGKDLKIILGSVNDMDFTYLNGTLAGFTGMETPSYWAVRREYIIPAGRAVAGRNVLAVLCENHFDTGVFIPADPVRIELADNHRRFVMLGPWKAKTVFEADTEKLGLRPGTSDADSRFNLPTALFNGMMNPWFRLAVKGVIWYQGCHNAGQKGYYLWHRFLIEDWRRRWNDPGMPFLIVQLAGYFQHSPEMRGTPNAERQAPPQMEPSFPMVREIQAEMRHLLPNVGLAAAIDTGDEYDIHPRNKQTVGVRLAMEAERIAYGKPVLSQGPEFDFMLREGDAIRVFFRHTEGGLRTSDGKAPGAFILLDRSGKLAWAEARLEGDSVLVRSPEIPDPVHVRYAYAGFCADCNLVNGVEFPALPFRSDKGDYSRIRL